ncbi:replication-relaxation family protein [Mycobacteroides abscessus]|uniref:replication-relaxation family protein n=1 Tax=Mycobacteroides abscessus TaxID=36809 RepID=UPI000D872B66|nr:replication-relaxation family protein [Mycobacteroides abscessus]SPX87804.1 Uncharacterised protein [Mycobacteroides abscessus]
MMARAGSGRDLLALLPSRDQQVLSDLLRVRLLTGAQIERLHFDTGDGTVASRGSRRRRTMNRLTELGLVTTLDRRIGGERAGSAGLVYALDAKGKRLAHDGNAATDRVRRPWPVGLSFVKHTLAVSELYVQLSETARAGRIALVDFLAEPASWHSTAYGLLKPDAFAVWQQSGWEEHLWFEVDRGTESVPTVRRQLERYLDAVAAGDSGARGVLPRVMVTVPTRRRQALIQREIHSLPSPAADYFSVELFDMAIAKLTGEKPRPPP